ncbi:hypothetical protein BGX38DRAFT_782666 [Terfezia claveryi]|nr:hypothetical protein BGX38DRAFT_782666 [Terfezia claveryi]
MGWCFFSRFFRYNGLICIISLFSVWCFFSCFFRYHGLICILAFSQCLQCYLQFIVVAGISLFSFQLVVRLSFSLLVVFLLFFRGISEARLRISKLSMFISGSIPD